MSEPTKDGVAARSCYCGWLGWTVEMHGRVTHKHGCPARRDAWCQSHAKLCLPEIGSTWMSRDPRDDGLKVRVLAVSDRFIKIQRFRKVLVRTDRFFKSYGAVIT